MSQASSQSSPSGNAPGVADAANTTQDVTLSVPATVFKVKTRLVVVDVVAQNGKGQTVTDL